MVHVLCMTVFVYADVFFSLVKKSSGVIFVFLVACHVLCFSCNDFFVLLMCTPYKCVTKLFTVFYYLFFLSKTTGRPKHEIRKASNDIERRVYGLMERFTSRAKLFEITRNPENLTGGGPWDELSREIWNVYNAKAQKATTYIKKLQLWQSVYLQMKVCICNGVVQNKIVNLKLMFY